MPRLTGLDDPSTLQAFLDAVVWGAATNADRGYLQAPFRSGVSIEDYQLDPLVRAIDMARTNLLIADDVGLGKTIDRSRAVGQSPKRGWFLQTPLAHKEKGPARDLFSGLQCASGGQ